MAYKDIIFYNNYHNGDIHVSRTFVQDIINKTKLPVSYIHHNYPNLLRTEGILEKGGPRISDDKLFFESENHLYINTWYNTKYGHRYYQCTLEALYYNFEIIYKQLQIPIEPIEEYIPHIDFLKLGDKVLSPIDEFFSNTKCDKFIFISSGPTLSGQSDNLDLSRAILDMSRRFSKYHFIITSPINIVCNNVTYSADFIKKTDENANDLLENAYISTKCDVIIGRSSDPYTFSNIKENIIGEKNQLIIESSVIELFLNKKYYGDSKKLIKLTDSSKIPNMVY